MMTGDAMFAIFYNNCSLNLLHILGAQFNASQEHPQHSLEHEPYFPYKKIPVTLHPVLSYSRYSGSDIYSGTFLPPRL